MNIQDFQIILDLKREAIERMKDKHDLAAVIDALDRAEKEIKGEVKPYGFLFEFGHSDRFMKRELAGSLLQMYSGRSEVVITPLFN